MDTAVKLPLSERINFRVIIFAAVILFLLGWPVFKFLSESLTGGIHDHGSYKEVDLKQLGNFSFDDYTGTVNDVPAKYRSLDGQKILLEGEIYDLQEAGPGIHDFQVVYSIAKCCFNGPPKVQERVFATAKKNAKVKYQYGVYHKVLGTLHVTTKRATLPGGEQGPVIEVYHLDVDSVEPA
jgi:hypothetical protein